eukprot:s3665_g2.t1
MSRATADLSETEDLMCQGFDAVGYSDSKLEEGEGQASHMKSRNGKVQASWQARARPLAEWRGDGLPIHPGAIAAELDGIDSHNLEWVRATVIVLNYLYCCGSVCPVRVPMRAALGENQLKAVQSLGKKVSCSLADSDRIPSLGTVQAMLSLEAPGALGKPVKNIDTLDAEKVIAAWPQAGAPGAAPIVELLDGSLLGSVRDPTGWWLPNDMRPQERTRSEDREGHYITIGAGGVTVEVEIGGRHVEAQWFVPIMLPSNEHSERYPGGRDALPFAGLLEAIVLPEENDHYMESWALSRAFSVFSIPDQWLPHFAFSKKVCASAFGGTKGGASEASLVCIALRVEEHAFTLIEGAMRVLVFGRCQAPRPVPAVNHWPQLSSGQLAVDCSDLVAELLGMRAFWKKIDAGRHSDMVGRFESECKAAGLLSATLQLIDALTSGVNVLTSEGHFESLTAMRGEALSFVALSVGLLQAEVWQAPPSAQEIAHRFGERFASANYPLTVAVAQAGGAVQRPLGLMIADNPWDYFTDPGKEALEYLEEDPALRWRHWSPDSFTFSTSLQRQVEKKGKGKCAGVQVRTEQQPCKGEELPRDDQVKIRQENRMVKRGLKGLEAADRQGGFAALLHPYDSFIWLTEEVEEMRSRPGFMITSWSFCCFGGRRSWFSMLHNSSRLHQALHHPGCYCARYYDLTSRPRQSGQPEAKRAEEFPWRFCVAYADAVVAGLQALMIPPLGTAQFDLAHLLYELVIEVEEIVRHMELGDEPRYLAGLARRLKLKGTDARLLYAKEEINGRIAGPVSSIQVVLAGSGGPCLGVAAKYPRASSNGFAGRTAPPSQAPPDFRHSDPATVRITNALPKDCPTPPSDMEATDSQQENLQQGFVTSAEVEAMGEHRSALELPPQDTLEPRNSESNLAEMIKAAIGEEMKEVWEQIAKLRKEVSSIQDLKRKMQKSLDRLAEEDQKRCKEISAHKEVLEHFLEDIQTIQKQSEADIARVEERISNHQASTKLQFRDVAGKISDCRGSAEEAVSRAGLQADLVKVETESVLNAVLGKIKQENEGRESELQLLRQNFQADINSLQSLVQGIEESVNAQVLQVLDAVKSEADKIPETPARGKRLRRQRQQVPEGRRHACWQGCLRCQGLSRVKEQQLKLGTPQQLKSSDYSVAASFDFASGAVLEDNAVKLDKADKVDKNIQDLVEEMEATCSASNTEHETIDQGHFGPV